MTYLEKPWLKSYKLGPYRLEESLAPYPQDPVFKALDDAAFFAAASVVPDRFVVTVSFTVYLTRPVTGGALRAEGQVTSQTTNLLVAESVLYNGDREVARGSGTFMPSKVALNTALGYE